MNERPEPLWRALLLAVAPVVAAEVGEGVREWLADRRAMDRCEHGRPGGRLCAACWPEPEGT